MSGPCNRKPHRSPETVDIFHLTELLGCNNPLYVKRFVITQNNFPKPTNTDLYDNYKLWLWNKADVALWHKNQKEQSRESA